jgi:hypothetical protein
VLTYCYENTTDIQQDRVESPATNDVVEGLPLLSNFYASEEPVSL